MEFSQLIPLAPEIVIVVSAMILLLAGVYKKDENSSIIFKASIIILALVCWKLTQYDYAPTLAMNDMFILDGFAIFTKVFILLAAIFVMMIALDQTKGKLTFEFPVLMLLSVTGMMVMVSANDLISLYMGIELQSLALYVLAAFRRNREKSAEAGLKYFILGALSSGILLYGASLIYGFTGTTNFTELANILSGDDVSVGVIFGMVMVFVGLCFKISAVPFHMWAPDVYEGAIKVVAAFFATAPKIAAIALFVRFAMQPFGDLFSQWQQIVIFVSVASMIVGSFGALKQTNIKRLMAYSSIGHVGFILIGLAAGTEAGIQAILIYIALYTAMTIGTWSAILLMKKRGSHVDEISDLAGLAKNRKLLAFGIAILMFSMAGIPPLAGFFGKWVVFQAAIETELYFLAIIGVLASVVSAFYYIRIIKVMYFDSSEEKLDSEATGAMKLVLMVTASFNIFFFLMPAPLFDAAKKAAMTLFI